MGLCVILAWTVPGLAGEVGCVRGQALPCMEGATGSSRRIFPKKKKTLWGTLGNSPAATAPVSSRPHHPWGTVCTSSRRELRLQAPPGAGCTSTGEGMHLISEGAETTGTTQGRVPINRECAYPPGSARTSSQRELRLQASPGGECPANGSVCTSSQRELRPQEPRRV